MIRGLSLYQIIIHLIAVLLSLSVHEMSHGLVSYWLGDKTARQRGRLSLNPLAHIDWMGLLCLLVFGFGWAKPVPVDPREYKDPKQGMVWTAFAGPAANFILAFVCIFLYCLLIRVAPVFLLHAEWIPDILISTAAISAGFGIFNLIPIPPLDGSKILLAFLPDREYYRITQGSMWTTILFLGLIMTGLIDAPINFLRSSMLNAFMDICLMLFGL